MTNLAQLHDCHSCYDERSIDQKKRSGTTFYPLLPCPLRRTGRRGQIQSDLAMVWLWMAQQWSQPWLPSRAGLAA